MANATAITLTDLTPGTGTAAPTADVLDTGTAAVTLPLAASGKGLDRIIVEITNTAAAALKVEALAGTAPPAGRGGLGDVTLVAALAQNGVTVVGGFEGARFVQALGKLSLKFTPSSGTIGVSIRAYRLAKSA